MVKAFFPTGRLALAAENINVGIAFRAAINRDLFAIGRPTGRTRKRATKGRQADWILAFTATNPDFAAAGTIRFENNSFAVGRITRTNLISRRSNQIGQAMGRIRFRQRQPKDIRVVRGV